MPRKTWVMIAAASGLALAAGAWATAGGPSEVTPTLLAQQSKGTGETFGEKVDDAVQSLKRGARATTETIQEEYQKARASVHDMGVQARVYSRLHWDKDLNTATIELEVKNGTAILRGRVGSLIAKAKAVELARDTVGVDHVDDHLTIEPATPPATPSPAVKSKT